MTRALILALALTFTLTGCATIPIVRCAAHYSNCN